MTTVAVLMSTYNGEKFIHKQIDSILNQEGEFQVKLWVRDDGSSDKTQEILKDYEKRGLLNWYTGENKGPAHSFWDLLIGCSEYDFYAYSDQDDFWEKDKIKCGITKLMACSSEAVYFANAELVDSELNTLNRVVYRKDPSLDFFTVMCAGGILGCTMMFNKKMYEKLKNKGIPRKMVLHDFYTVAVCLSVGGEIIYDKEPHMKYRQHADNVVGVSHGISGKIKNRIKIITSKSKISISEQADTLLSMYYDEIPEEKRKWLVKIANYKKTFISRVGMTLTRKTRYSSRNMGVSIRLSLLLGNR